MAELKPCPFCGGEAKKYKVESPFGVFIYVSCTNCNAATAGESDEDRAITNWNRRVDADGMRCAAKIIAKSDWEQEG